MSRLPPHPVAEGLALSYGLYRFRGEARGFLTTLPCLEAVQAVEGERHCSWVTYGITRG